MIEDIIQRHSLCGMRRAELQEVMDELRDESRNESRDESRDNFRDKMILEESGGDRERSRLNEIARAVEALN